MQEYPELHALAPIVTELCTPLAEHFGITYFMYFSKLKNQQGVKLSNRPEWIDHVVETNLINQCRFAQDLTDFKTGYVLWDEFENPEIVAHAREEFDICNCFTLLNQYDDGYELCHFGSTKSNTDIKHFYVDNVHLFERFLIYFKQQIKPYLHKSDIKVLNTKVAATRQAGVLTQKLDQDIDAFIRETQLKQLPIQHEFGNTELTAREAQVLQELMYGSTMKEIAEHLFISARTVETHLNHLKDKLNCDSRSSLVKRTHDLGLAPLLR